jgi:phosphoserine phosphatase
MDSKAIDVFDLDGTLIKTNSFREITKRTTLVLLKRFRLKQAFALIGAYALRRTGIYSHIMFARLAVNIFEKELTEEEKKGICQSVFDENVVDNVLKLMQTSSNCIICTASPYAYVSRMSFGKDVVFISALDPRGLYPDAANVGEGKIQNLTAYFGKDTILIANFYTDSYVDQPLINLAENAFMCRQGHIQKIK